MSKKLAFQDNVVGEIINIGPDEEFVTINQLAETISKQINFELQPIYMPGRPQEVRFATCSADKARTLLGYKTQFSLEEGIREMIEYIKLKGTKKFRYHLDLEIINELTPNTWKNRMF